MPPLNIGLNIVALSSGDVPVSEGGGRLQKCKQLVLEPLTNKFRITKYSRFNLLNFLVWEAVTTKSSSTINISCQIIQEIIFQAIFKYIYTCSIFKLRVQKLIP